MKSIERVTATIEGHIPDRTPFTLGLSLYGAKVAGCPLPRYYTDPDAYVHGQTMIQEIFQPDIIFGPFAFGVLGSAFGSEIKYFTDQAPMIRRPAISSINEWDSLVMPDPDTSPALLYMRRAIQMLTEKYQNSIPVAAILPSPIDLPALIMGMDVWMETVLFDKAGTERVMEKIIPFFTDLANRCLADGASFILSPCGFASSSMVTRGIVQSFSRPALEKTLSDLHGMIIIHHCGTPIISHLDLLTDLPRAIGFVIDAKDDLNQAREIVGPEPVLIGGLSNLVLEIMTAQEVLNECRKVLDNRKDDTRFILCNSGPDIPWNTPVENLHAFRTVVESMSRCN